MKNALTLAEKATEMHDEILQNTPATLFDNVKDVLQTLKNRKVKMVLLTEGNKIMQEKTLATHDLQKFFDNIVICTEKNEYCFLEIKNQWNNATIYVIRDGIERDIEPGNRIGAITIWKPGKFNPVIPGKGLKKPDFVVKDIKNVLSIVKN
jgi:FMN phosphatase YigB (HAD superfamily)